ncbi:uncharacterized protein LDX57_011523 [Aspergillus melleus]|uniref:uncharacterized protein n=1 Tax=Aspergillus melleus TaxID=138277 RepID=UPI001E8D5ED8|nr:uncharacterized protein LDX57_011523 [Aspergillus melleus]KAH8433887.1 hypothetical protein LDX57_011523 [Aspergillus melleus]
MAYHLTNDDLEYLEWDTAPVRAARNPNPAVLEALMAFYQDRLSHWDELSEEDQYELQFLAPNMDVSGAIWGNYESPLTAAIRAKSLRNVDLLLKSGADVNGIAHIDLSDYSVRFLRGRDSVIDVTSFSLCPPRAQLLATAKAKGIESQTVPLTSAELDERRIGFPRFWTEPNVPAQRLRMSIALTSLEVAAQCGCEEIFDMLHQAGAEDSAWQASTAAQDNNMLEVPSEASLSALSVSSPIHQAIASGHRDMLQKLIHNYNYSPNYRPLVAPTVALPPLSFAIARCDLEIPGVRGCISDLLAHPRVLPHLRTPVFGVHPLHFATARHDPDLLAWVAGSIQGGHLAAGQTALGHTLLLVASLPLTGNYATQDKPAVKRSIRCARTLDSKWLQHSRPSPEHVQTRASRPPYHILHKPFKPVPMTEAENGAQLATIQLLLEWGGFDVRDQDVDGNTALHYLAATVNVSPETIDLVRAMDGGEEVWESSVNWCGFSPKQLMDDTTATVTQTTTVACVE